MTALRGKQAAFVQEYLIDLNATQAAIRAGYSEKTAAKIGSENLIKPDIAEAIRLEQENRKQRTQIDADYVLKRLVEIDQMDAKDILNDDGAIKPISQWPKIWRQYLSGIDVTEISNEGAIIGQIKKIKWPDKVKNLELLGKHIGVGAFSEKLQLSNDPDNPLIDTKASAKKLAALAKLKLATKKAGM